MCARYSFGIYLVAMINAEKNAVEFFFECPRKHMKKKNRRGVGMVILNNRMLNQNWKPNLPARFVQAYQKLVALIRRCWTMDRDPRPDFDEIVRLLQGEIADEVRRAMEPNIQQLSEEPDEVYWDEVKRIAESKVGGQEEADDVSEMDAMRAKYESMVAELAELKKGGGATKVVTKAVVAEVETATERKADLVKTAQDEELALMMGMMNR